MFTEKQQTITDVTQELPIHKHFLDISDISIYGPFFCKTFFSVRWETIFYKSKPKTKTVERIECKT